MYKTKSSEYFVLYKKTQKFSLSDARVEIFVLA